MAFDKFLDALSRDEFEEKPVDLDTFMTDEQFLGKSVGKVKLSPIQKEIIERGSQIYNLDTMIALHGKEKGTQLHKSMITRSLLLMLGKGSGKDFLTRIMCAYVVHKLLCLRDPSGYFGKPTGDDIFIVNMALNADQASSVFFSPLKRMMMNSEWFKDRLVTEHTKDLEFKKAIYLFSLHSSWEGAEGKNVIVAVLDEIDGFTTEGYSQSMYNALSYTVTTRFPNNGKVVCLSFPRSKNGWMFTTYDRVVGKNKITETFQHTFKIDEDLPDGIEGNEFTVEWDEDTITGYDRSSWFALKAPTFRVNPTTRIEDFRDAFYEDKESNTSETLMRVCANPPENVNSTFFKNQDRVAEAFDQENGWDQETETFTVIPNLDKEYYLHVDLSQTGDRTAVALGHVSHWQQIQIGASLDEDTKPYVVIDLFRVWEPNPQNPVDNVEVVNFILDIAKKFPLQLVTFDRWGSFDMIKYLNERGVDAERKSLDRSHYMEFNFAVQDRRLKGPEDKRLAKEMRNLIIDKGKVREPDGKGHFNDISEACCGVINNCVEHALEEFDVEVVTSGTLKKESLREREKSATMGVQKQEMTGELKDFLAGLGAI